jgi:hypothetical protein
MVSSFQLQKKETPAARDSGRRFGKNVSRQWLVSLRLSVWPILPSIQE